MPRQTHQQGSRSGAATWCAVALLAWSALFIPRTDADDVVATAENGAEKADAVEENDKGTKGWRNPMPAFTPEREAAAVTFVTAHHPELTPLLAHLKISRPSEYQKAIRKLFGDSERLAHSREMQPRRYDLELQDWKLESRAQLLVARLTMGRTPELESQLRSVLADQLDVQRELLNLERERVAQRAAAIDKEISKLDDRREQQLKDRFEKALKSAGQRKQSLKAGKNDAKSPAAEPTTNP